MREGPLVLGIETSCDETAAALVAGGRQVLSNVVASQVDLHRAFGGVVPEIASRKHVELVGLVVEEALEQAGVGWEEVEVVAVTKGPGLIGSLVVGLCFAKAICWARGLPLVGVNHLEGHLYSTFLADDPPQFPFVCLIVSGGHTDLVYVPRHGVYRLLGRTRDDAAGEAFDKVGRALGLPYPGGPQVDRLAEQGDPGRFPFPRALGDSWDFSFSGLKTAVLRTLEQLPPERREEWLPHVAASFQEAVVEVLVEKTFAAARQWGVRHVALCGGVAANRRLRAAAQERAKALGMHLSIPPLWLCTDNASMIAAAGAYRWLHGLQDGLDLDVFASLELTSWPLEGEGR